MITKIAIALNVLLLGLVLWLSGNPFSNKAAAQNEPVRMINTSLAIINTPEQEITPAKVVVRAPVAKEKLKLPADVKRDESIYVLDSVSLPKDTHGHTITTVIDSDTGKVATYDNREPLPWVSGEKSGGVRFDYGIKSNTGLVGRLSLKEDLFQVKLLRAGVNGSVDTDGQFFIGAGAEWQW